MKPIVALALCVVTASAAARADDVQPASSSASTEPASAPPPRRTPFDRGRVGLSVSGGTQTAFGTEYFVLGGGVAYYVLDGVELGLSGLYEFGSGPSISKLSPSLRYIAKPLVGTWPIIPYVGVFYNHWFIGDDNPDVDSVGARAGFVYLSGSLVLGLGVAVEQTVSTCTTDCALVYPDFAISLAL